MPDDELDQTGARPPAEFISIAGKRRAATKEDLQRTAAELREEIHRVESSLRDEIHSTKVDLLKWSFAFWIGNIAVLSGIMFALLRSAR
jgi:hypothetical protein